MFVGHVFSQWEGGIGGGGMFHSIAIFNGLIFERPGRWYSACLEKSQNKTLDIDMLNYKWLRK